MATGGTRSVSIIALNRDYGRIVDQVVNGKATALVTRKGRPQVAILPVDEYEELLEARRQLEMVRMARREREEKGGEGDGTV